MGNASTKSPWKPSHIPDAECPTNKPLDPKQIKNEHDTYVWKLSDMERLERFLVLGTDFCYIANDRVPERKYLDFLDSTGIASILNNLLMKLQILPKMDKLILDKRGKEAVQMLSEYSEMGRTPRQNYIILALAVCARSNDVETKKMAYESLLKICRIPTHLFLFLHYCKQESGKCGKSKGWGRAHRNAVIKWYQDKCQNPLNAARLLTKYKARQFTETSEDKGAETKKSENKKVEKWSHKDVFCLAHPSDKKMKNDEMKVILRYVMKGFNEAKKLVQEEMGSNDKILKMLSFVDATEKAKHCTDEDTLVQLIIKHALEREHVPTQMIRSDKVYKALVMSMEPEAKLRNLRKISERGLCPSGSEVEKEIVKTLNDREMIRDARVHPFRILVALMSYETGTREKKIRRKDGSLETHEFKWEVNRKVIDALYQAFEHSFINPNAKTTGKRFLLAINVSGGMAVPCAGCREITCNQAAAAMVMMTVHTEENCKVLTFADEVKRMRFKKDDTVANIMQKMNDIGKTLKMDNTDCALPMRWALEKKKTIDVFIVFTDNVPNTGQIHASEALRKYRDKMKIPNAKLIVVAMATNECTIADPLDNEMLNIVGFDTKATDIIAEFSLN